MSDPPSLGGLLFLLLTGLLAGGVNAIAGGGSLLVFPALLALGYTPLQANVTNSVGQWPGYLGAVTGARRELTGQGRRILLTSIVSVVGAAVGCLLLLALPQYVFDAVVPMLVLAAAAMLALKPRIGRWVPLTRVGPPDTRMRARRDDPASGNEQRDRVVPLLVTVFFAAVYGGYFGGALGVILIATLSLLTADRLVRLNALKALLALMIATVTVVIFGLGAPVDWVAVALIAPSTLIGGFLGARVARELPEEVLRWTVVAVAVAVAVYLML